MVIIEDRGGIFEGKESIDIGILANMIVFI